MAKFNIINTTKTENRSGHAAYRMSKKEQFMSVVVTTMFGEEKYHGSTDDEIVRLATELCEKSKSAGIVSQTTASMILFLK